MPVGTRPAPPVDTVRVSLSGTVKTSPWVNVMWLKLTAATRVINDLKSVIDSLAADYASSVVSLMSNDVNFTEAKAVWITGVGTELVYDGAYALGGAVGAASVQDVSCCAVIDHSISSYYRGGHPRTYLPGLYPGAVVDGRTIDPTVRANIAAGAVAYRSAVDALTHGDISAVEIGTVRFQSHDAWLTPPVFFPWTGDSVRRVLGSQRRRLQG